MRSRYKPWAIEYLKTNTQNEFFLNEDSIEENRIFSFINERDTFLEIGPGRGQFILTMAAKFPDFNFLVIELDKSIAGSTLKKIDDAKLSNVKLIAGDFYVLSKLLKKDCFCGIFLNFSDPWPKKRHEKRRLTSPNFLVEYAKVLKSDGKIYYKTDNDLFYEYSLEKFNEYKWNIVYQNENYDSLENDFDVETEFEKRYKEEGIKIKRLVLEKTELTLKEVIE